MSYIHIIDEKEVTPFGQLKMTEYVEEGLRERIKLESDIVLMDKSSLSLTDYSYILSLDKETLHYYSISKNGISVYNGVFIYQDCSFNGDDKTVSIKMTPNDSYAIINNGKDREGNILDCDEIHELPSTIDMYTKTRLTFSIYKYNYAGQTFPLPDREYPEADSTEYDVYAEYYTGQNTVSPCIVTIFASERVVVHKNKTLTGWTELDNYSNHKLWGRPSYAYPKPVVGNVESQREVKISLNQQEVGYYNIGVVKYPYVDRWGDGGWLYVESNEYAHVKKEVFNGEEYSAFTTLNRSITGISLRGAITNLLRNAIPEFDGDVKSCFLFGTEDAGTGSETIKYDQSLRSFKKLMVIPKSNFRLSSNTYGGGSSIENTTLNTLLSDICDLFKCFWYIDTEGNLRIEHVSYTLKEGEIDLTDCDTVDNKWSYDSEKIPRRITISQNDAYLSDFKDKEILYSDIPAVDGDSEKTEEIRLSYLSTDIDGALLWIQEIGDTGCVLVDVDESTNNIVRGLCMSSGRTSQQNSALSFGNILYLYHRHNCYKKKFSMNNGLSYDAITTLKLKIQPAVSFVSKQKPTLKNNVTTRIGQADIDSISYNLDEDNIYTVKLKYDY
jgi:hypothetical protein